ncbi:DUF2958 domain-containing protein [Candidatus Neomarinimicrobiota bacterium]
MKLLLNHQIDVLQKQFRIYDQTNLKDLKIVAKLFCLNSNYTWYLITQNPYNPDCLYAIVEGNYVEAGSVLLSDLKSLRYLAIPAVERDIHFRPCSVKSLWDRLNGITDQPICVEPGEIDSANFAAANL